MKLSEYLLAIAIREIENIPKGREFLVNDLYKKADWDLIPLEIRMELGRELNKYYSNLTISVVKALGKIDGVQQYKKL